MEGVNPMPKMNSPPKKQTAPKVGSSGAAKLNDNNGQAQAQALNTTAVRACPHLKPPLSFLHVRPDGQEVRFDQRPDDVPCLAIASYKSHERTATKLVWLVGDDDLPIIVEPRGVGWRLLGLDEGSAIWWRAA
jgi:hypothetical protein